MSNFLTDKLLEVTCGVIKQVFKRLSPVIRGKIEHFVLALEADARETTNPWDDLAVDLIKAILDIE